MSYRDTGPVLSPLFPQQQEKAHCMLISSFEGTSPGVRNWYRHASQGHHQKKKKKPWCLAAMIIRACPLDLLNHPHVLEPDSKARQQRPLVIRGRAIDNGR